MATTQPASIAVLIDAENVSADAAETMFREMEEAGRTVVRRAFADFAAGCGAAWLAVAGRYGIDTVQVVSPGKGKNSADIRLTIDAIDLLLTRRIDVFCLVTSDGDFAPLAAYLRGAGSKVVGYGKATASLAFRQACSAFHEFLGLPSPGPVATKRTQPPALAPVLALVPKNGTKPAPQTCLDEKAAHDKALAAFIGRAGRSMTACPEGWMRVSELGTVLRRDNPGFAMADYGGGTLGKALARMPDAVVEVQPSGMRFRLLKTLKAV